VSERVWVTAVMLGVVLRLLAVVWHDEPRGDVLLDVGVARSLAHGEGFGSGYQRGTALVIGDAPVPPLDRADQHAPLWSLIGARLAWVAGSAFKGLRLGSLLLGLLLLGLVWQQAQRMVRSVPDPPAGLPGLAVALVAMSFVLIDFSGNGSLYMAQACVAVTLVRLLGRRRPSALALGVLLGAAWLLNHQALVLLPVPFIVLLLTSPAAKRLRAAEAGLLAIAVALLFQGPWWWRNATVFDDAFYSTNSVYPLARAGVEPALGLEGGVPVARFADPDGPLWMLSVVRLWLPANLLYLLSTGLLLWPGLLGVLGGALAPMIAGALARRDRRLLACLVTAGMLAGVALAWPAMKLRYLVPPTPLVVLLGVRALAAPPTPGERRWGLVVALGWLALLAATWGDLSGSEPDPRPQRWWTMAVGGGLLVLLPLWLRHARAVPGRLKLLACSGVLVTPLITAAALLPEPHTAYHSSVLTPDAFGQHKEGDAERRVATLDLARRAMLQDGAGAVVGPLELLAWRSPRLISLPLGAGSPQGEQALATWIDAGTARHVFVFGDQGWLVPGQVGERWLAGRLEVVALWEDPDAARGVLSRVTDER
jgi:4-amino-4-deoxy-L-arabinose transferase-like glycosyltransferase